MSGTAGPFVTMMILAHGRAGRVYADPFSIRERKNIIQEREREREKERERMCVYI